MNTLEVEKTIDGKEYWAEYEYGTEYTDAPEEREYAVVTLKDLGYWDSQHEAFIQVSEPSIELLDVLDSAAIHQAEDILNLS